MKMVLYGLAACLVASQPVAAMTLGEFRKAYADLHALDPIAQKDRAAYITAHRVEIDLARTRLEDAVMVRDALLRMNGILIEQGKHPFLCNYETDDIDDEQMPLAEWVDEFRSEALEKFKLVAGPKTDKVLDDVDYDDVIAHKMLEKFPCPATLAPPSSVAGAMAPAHHH